MAKTKNKTPSTKTAPRKKPLPKGEETLEAKKLADNLEEVVLGRVTPVELENPFATLGEGVSASPPKEKPKPVENSQPPPTTPSAKMLVTETDCPWPSSTMEEVREIQNLFHRNQRGALQMFWGVMSDNQLARWNELDEGTRHRTVEAVVRQFADENLIAAWAHYLNSLPHPPAVRRKFKMLVMVFGMQALSEEATRHEYQEKAADV